MAAWIPGYGWYDPPGRSAPDDSVGTNEDKVGGGGGGSRPGPSGKRPRTGKEAQRRARERVQRQAHLTAEEARARIAAQQARLEARREAAMKARLSALTSGAEASLGDVVAAERQKAYEAILAVSRRVMYLADEVAKGEKRGVSDPLARAKVRVFEPQKLSNRALLRQMRDVDRASSSRGGALDWRVEQLKIIDAEIERRAKAVVDDVMAVNERLERLEAKGRYAAIVRLLDSEDVRRVRREHGELFGPGRGIPGLWDRYVMIRQRIAGRYGTWLDQQFTAFAKPRSSVEYDPTTGKVVPDRWQTQAQAGAGLGSVFAQALELRAEALTRRYVAKDGRVILRPTNTLMTQQAQAQEYALHRLSVVREDAEAAGIVWEEKSFTDPQWVESVLDAAGRGFDERYWAANGPLPVGRQHGLAGTFFESPEEEARFDALMEEYRPRRKQFDDWLYQLFQGRDAPSALERLANTTVLGPALDGLLQVLNAPVAIVGGAAKLAYGIEGEMLGPQVNPETLFGNGLRDPARIVKHLGAYGKPPGLFGSGESFDFARYDAWLRTSDGKAFEAFVRERDPSARGLVQLPGDIRKDGTIIPYFYGLFGHDVSPEARARAAQERDALLAEIVGAVAPPTVEDLARGAPVKGRFEEALDVLHAVNAYSGAGPFAPDAGNVVNLAILLLGDPLNAYKFSRLPRLFQYAVAASVGGKGDLFSVFSEQLIKHRFGFSIPGRVRAGPGGLSVAGSDEVGDWLALRRVAAALKRDVSSFGDVKEADLAAILEASLRRSPKDPTVDLAGFGARFRLALEKRGVRFDREVQSQSQVLAAVEDYLRANVGARVIEASDWARQRRVAQRFVKAAEDRRLDKARDVAEAVVAPVRRGAFREAHRARRAAIGKRRSVFEAAADFVDHVPPKPGRLTAPDFRSPPVRRISVDRLQFERRYGRPVPDTVSVMAIGEARHAEDIIAIADSLARRHGLGLRWARSADALVAGKPVAELFGGEVGVMASVADELQRLMADNRLGSLTRPSGLPAYRAVDDGRVLYRDVFGLPADRALEAASLAGTGGRRAYDLIAKRKGWRAIAEAAGFRADSFAPRVEGLAQRIESLRAVAATGDAAAAADLARAVAEQRVVLRNVARFQRVRDSALRRLRGDPTDARPFSRLDAAWEIALERELDRDLRWINRELARARGSLRKGLAPRYQRGVLARIAWLEDAARGADLIRSDVKGPVHVARGVVARHGKDARGLVPSQRVAPFPDPKPGSGVSVAEALDLESARELRTQLLSANVVSPGVPPPAVDRAVEVVLGMPDLAILPQGALPQLRGSFLQIFPVLRLMFRTDVALWSVPEVEAWVRRVLDELRHAGVDLKVVASYSTLPAKTPIEEAYRVLDAVYAGFVHRYGAGGVVDFATYQVLDEKIAALVAAVRGYRVRRYTGPGPRDWWDPLGPGGGSVMEDWDWAVVAAKAQFLGGQGIPVESWDRLRGLFQRTQVRRMRARDIEAEAARRGGDRRETYLSVRDSRAASISDQMLFNHAMRQPYGMSVGEVWDDFVRSLEEDQLRSPAGRTVTPWEYDVLRAAVAELAGPRLVGDVLDHGAWAKAVDAIAPPFDLQFRAKEYLVERGFWTPKTADDILNGRRIWSASEEGQYWLANYGVLPKWVDVPYLQSIGAFDSQFSYDKAMVDLGVQDLTVDLAQRMAVDAGEAKRLQVVWGVPDPVDPAAWVVKPLRSIADKREWMIGRWGGAVGDPMGLRAAPWLMDPRSREYRAYYATRVRTVVDRTLMPGEDAAAFGEVLARIGPRYVEELREAVGDGVLMEQALLNVQIRLADELLASTRWRSLLGRGRIGRQPALYTGLGILGFLQRLNVVTQIAFPFLNRFEVAPVVGPKRFVINRALRDVVKDSDVPVEVYMRFPNYESTGLGPGSSMWELRGESGPMQVRRGLKGARGPAPVLDDYLDVARGVFRTVTEAGLDLSAHGEQALKLQMFRRLYTDRYYRLIADGIDDAVADGIARLEATQRTMHFFPNLAGAPTWVKVLNEIVPFLHYRFASATLYAREFIANPWMIHKLWVLGNAVEAWNRATWEYEHPGLPYPDESRVRQLQIWVDGEAYTIDALGLSDAFIGVKALALVGGGQSVPLYKALQQFIRVPHPWQANILALINGDVSPYTGRPVSGGQIVWPLSVIEWLNDSLSDRSLGVGDLYRLGTKMAFFSESQKLDPLRSLSAMYFALATDAQRESFLDKHPQLREYWASLPQDPDKVDLARKGLINGNWFRSVTAGDRAAFERADEGLDRLVSLYDEREEELLVSGVPPGSAAMRELREERRLAILRFRTENPILIDYAAFYMDQADWNERLRQQYVDFLWDRWGALDGLKPKAEDFEDDLSFQRALRDYYAERRAFLDAHPELMQAMGRERTAVEEAVSDVYERLGDVLDEIGERNVRIARLEAHGRFDRAAVLREINEMAYLEAETPTRIDVRLSPPEFLGDVLDMPGGRDAVRDAAMYGDDVLFPIVMPGLSDRRWMDASPEERAVMRRDFWYREEMGRLWDLAGDGEDAGARWYRALQERPALRAEYLARNPDKASEWADREYYQRKLDHVLGVIRRTGDWSHWWGLLESDRRFREFYLRTHPDKAGSFKGTLVNFKRLGGLVAKAEATGDWSVVWRGLQKDPRLRDWWLAQEPGRRRRWESQARFLAAVGPVIERAVRSGDWREFRDLLRRDASVRDAFFRGRPGAREAWLRDEVYANAIDHWQRLSAGGRAEAAADYFSGLPQWVRDRFYRTAGSGGKASAESQAYFVAMRRWVSLFEAGKDAEAMRYFDRLPPWIRERYYRAHPDRRESFARFSEYGRLMRGWVAFFERRDWEGAKRYFESLPLWARQQYYANNPDQKPSDGWGAPVTDWDLDRRFQSQTAEFMLLSPPERHAYLRDHPEFREYFRERTRDAEGRRALIFAGLMGLPDDPWLKRLYRERYPEVFSPEAQGVRRVRRVEEFLGEHPGMRDDVAAAVALLTQTYLGQTRYYGKAPDPVVLERLSEEERARRRRRLRRLGHGGWEEWSNVPVEVPGLSNVLTGVA